LKHGWPIPDPVDRDNPLTHVRAPLDPYDWSLTLDGRITFDIVFTSPVRIDSVVPGESVVVDTPHKRNAPGDIQALLPVHPSVDAVRFSWTSKAKWEDLLAPPPDSAFVVHILGTNPSGRHAVIAHTGEALDGNGDGRPGGVFSNWFIVVG